MRSIDYDKYPELEQAREIIRSEFPAYPDINTTVVCDRVLKEYVPLEKNVQKAVIKRLQIAFGNEADIWKEQGSMYSRAGRPDVSMLYRGMFFAFEVKRPYFGQPTAIQIATIKRINECGGHAFVVRSAMEAVRFVKNVIKP